MGNNKSGLKVVVSSKVAQPSFVRNVLFSFALQLVSLVLGILSSVITARWLGPEGKGIVQTLRTFTSFVSTIAFFGIQVSVIYYAASKKYSYKEIVNNFTFFLLTFSLPLSLLSLGIAPFLEENILKGVPLPFIIVAMLLIPLSSLQSLLESLLRAQQRFSELFLLGVSASLLGLFLLSLFLIILKLGVLGAMLASWFLIPFSIAIFLHFLKDSVKPEFFKPIFQKDVLKKLITYGLKGFLANILWMMNLRLDVFIVNYFLSPSAVGLYMTGVAYTELSLRLLPSAISSVLFPKMSASTKDEADRIACMVTSTITLFLILASVLSYLLAPVIIPFFYGRAFNPSVSVVGYLLPGVITWALGSQLNAYLMGKGHPEVGIWASVSGLVVTVSLDFILIPSMGIIGASIASSAAYTTAFIIRLYFFHRLSGGLPIWRIFIPTVNDIRYLVEMMRTRLQQFKKVNRTKNN